MAAAGAQIAQSTVDLIHEIAAVRQTSERVVIAGVLEAVLELLALLDLGDQTTVCRLQLAAGVRERFLRAIETVHQIVRRECEQPRHRGEQADGKSEIA